MCHPERSSAKRNEMAVSNINCGTKSKFCVVEACRAEQNRGMEQAAGARNDDGIYKRLPIAFLGQMNCSECTNAKEGRGFVRTKCAARSARACASGALRASQGRYAPMFRMTAGGKIWWYAFVYEVVRSPFVWR